MKHYEYVTLKIGKIFGGKTEEHREIIDEYAAKGYRYADYVPSVVYNNGTVKAIDLIFEKDE